MSATSETRTPSAHPSTGAPQPGLGLNLHLTSPDRTRRLVLGNALSAVLVGAGFLAAVLAHEVRKKDPKDREIRKVSFVRTQPKPKPKPALKKEPPKPKPRPRAPKPGPPRKQRITAPQRKVAAKLEAPTTVPVKADKPPMTIEDMDVHAGLGGTEDETMGEFGGAEEAPPPGPTGEGGEPEPPPPPPPPPPPKPKLVKTIFLRAHMPRPQRIEGRDCVFTEAARAAGVSGQLILLYKIGPTGRVVSVKVLRNLPILGESCVATVKRWRFEPIKDGGQPVSVLVQQAFTFKLE